jgi:hypothetical protein
MAQKARARDILTRRAQQRYNPMEYLGDPSLNDFQRQVFAQGYLGGRNAAGALPGQREQLGWAKLQSDMAEGARRHEQQMAAIQAESERARLAAEDARARGDREAADRARAMDLQMQDLKFELEEARADRESRERVENAKTAVDEKRVDGQIASQEAEDRKLEEAQGMAERRQREQQAIVQHGIGAQHIMQGNYGTPEAQKTLQQIAREADKGWFGFWKGDAERMNATLKSLGVDDVHTRRMLVERYGLGPSQEAVFGPGVGMGRGARTSMLLHGAPSYE